MSDAEVAGNFGAALEKVRQGLEVIVEHDNRPIAVLKATETPRRTVSEILALMPKDSTAVIDRSSGGSLARRLKSASVYRATRRISLMMPSGVKPSALPAEAHTTAPTGNIWSWMVSRSTTSRGSRRPYAAATLFVARSTGCSTYPKALSHSRARQAPRKCWARA